MRAATIVLGVVVVLAVATGGLERYWVATHTIGTLTSDGAVIGLMALHLLHNGQFPAYMWGQAYGGSLEMLLTAIVFAVVGVGTSQLIATTAITSAVAAFAMWRASRRLVGEPAALIGALALWIWPALFTWRSLKPGGTYIVGLALAWFAVGWLVRVRQGDARTPVLVMAGVCCGLAFWSSPMTLQLLVPTVLWSAAALVALGRRFGWLLAGAVVGAMPAVVFGATHAFANLSPPGGGEFYRGFGVRLVQFFEYEVPIASSLRVEGTLHWVLGEVGIVLAVALAVGFAALVVAVLRHRATRCELPVLTLVLLPVLYSLNTLADHVGQGRYVLLGSSMGAVLVGVGLDNAGGMVASWWRRRRAEHAGVARTVRPRGVWGGLVVWSVGLALLAALGVTALFDEPGAVLAEFPVGGAPMPANDEALRALVAEHHVRDAFSGYWMAYRLMFETDQHVAVTPFSIGRYPPIRDEVRSSPRPAYLFVTASPTERQFVAWCTAHRIWVKAWSLGPFTLVQPARRIYPRQMPRGVLSPKGPPHPANALGAPRAGGG